MGGGNMGEYFAILGDRFHAVAIRRKKWLSKLHKLVRASSLHKHNLLAQRADKTNQLSS